MKFKSWDLDFNEFPILERFKPFLNRKFEIWSNDSNSNLWHFWNPRQGLEFKRIFNPIHLNSIYFIELEGRFRKEIGSNFRWTWVNWTRNIFSNIPRLSFKVLKTKPRQRWGIKWWRDYWWNDETKSIWQWRIDMRVLGIDSRDSQGTCMEKAMCTWNARTVRWLGGEITWSGDHDIRTCQGRGVAYLHVDHVLATVVIKLGEWYCTHTKHMMRSG
jgi:hypothetical protein